MRLILLGGYFFGKIWKNGRFSGRLWPDWGNTTWADMAGLGSIGLRLIRQVFWEKLCFGHVTLL